MQDKPLTEECRWRNAATCFFLTLKIGVRGGVSGNRKDFMDLRKTGFQHANVTRKRTGSHFQLRMNLAQPRAMSCEDVEVARNSISS